MLHLRTFHHGRVVRLEFLRRTQHEFVLHPARVLHDEANRFALAHGEVGRREAHRVGHVDIDGALDLGGNAGLADGLALVVPAGVRARRQGGGGPEGKESGERGGSDRMVHDFPLLSG